MRRALRNWLRARYAERYDYADRLSAWWHKYVGSVAFLAVIVVTSIGFWTAGENVKRIEQLQSMMYLERDARIAAMLYERDERIAAQLAHQAALAKIEVEAAKQIADAQLRTIRQANFDACERENQLRRRLRASVSAQIEIARSMGISALSRLSTVREYVEIMNRQENALVLLYGELDQVDCEAAYPPVVATP